VDIISCIQELLFDHDCVIIPGFGGFIGNYSPAKIDKATGTFFPPVKQISFNRNLNNNDGLLIRKISSVGGLNYKDARSMAEEFAAGLSRKLEKGEKVVFDQIGSFMNNHEGNIQFEPDSSVNYNPDSFGLESFTCKPVTGYDVRKQISGQPQKVTREHTILRKYLWRAAVILPVAGVLAFVSLQTDFLKAKVETSNLNPLASAEFEHNKTALDNAVITDSSAFASTAEVTQPSAADGTVLQPSAEASVKPATSSAGKITAESSYFIITGSFQSEINAGKQVKQLQAEGFNPEVVQGGNGFYRVCALACPDLATAVAKKDSIVEKFPGSWISRKK
jgi:nucleoid DNA-binding protein/cell division septation protein DedD